VERVLRERRQTSHPVAAWGTNSLEQSHLNADPQAPGNEF